MESTELWNIKQLKSPPFTTNKINMQEREFVALQKIVSEAASNFNRYRIFEKEATFLSRFVYCMKTKLRHCKGLKMIGKMNQALLRYLRMNIVLQLETFLNALPQSYSEDEYVPSRSVLQYLLVRLQGLAKLMVRLVETSKVAASTLEGLMSIGHMWKVYLLAYGIVARIHTVSIEIAKYCCRLYSLLLPFVPILQNLNVNWLPEGYELPTDLHAWLDTDCLDDIPENVDIDKPFLSLLNYEIDSEEEVVNEITLTKGLPESKKIDEDLGIPILKKTKKKISERRVPNLKTLDDLRKFADNFRKRPERYSDNFKKMDRMQCEMLHKLLLRCLKKGTKNRNNPQKMSACLAEATSALTHL